MITFADCYCCSGLDVLSLDCKILLPDHHHMVLQVQRTMARSIRQVVRGYMQGCKGEARKLGFVENLYDAPPFYRVLTHKGQLHAMIEYVKANAERAYES